MISRYLSTKKPADGVLGEFDSWTTTVGCDNQPSRTDSAGSYEVSCLPLRQWPETATSSQMKEYKSSTAEAISMLNHRIMHVRVVLAAVPFEGVFEITLDVLSGCVVGGKWALHGE